MKGKSLYFTEFLFNIQHEEDCNYYLPILINTTSAEGAALVRGKMARDLQTHFNAVKFTPLRQFRNPMFSEMLRSFVELQCQAQIFKLNLGRKELISMENDAIELSDHMRIVPQHLNLIFRHTISYHLERACLLTTQFHKEIDFDKDYLVLRIS